MPTSSSTDMTSAEAVLCVMGPNSRALLEAVSGADLSNAAHPFATWREIEIGYAPVRAARVTYVGELGWELYVADRIRARRVRRADGGGRRHSA